MLRFHIIPRMQTRRTQYNLRDVEAAIRSVPLPFTRPTYLVQVDVHTLEQRQTLERNLKRVHRNIAYRIEQLGEHNV